MTGADRGQLWGWLTTPYSSGSGTPEEIAVDRFSLNYRRFPEVLNDYKLQETQRYGVSFLGHASEGEIP